MVDISKVGTVSVPKRSALEPSRRDLSEDVSFGIGTIGTLLAVEQSSLENRPRGCDIHRRLRYKIPLPRGTIAIIFKEGEESAYFRFFWKQMPLASACVYGLL